MKLKNFASVPGLWPLILINNKLGRRRKAVVTSLAEADITTLGKRGDNLKNKSFPDNTLGKSKQRVLTIR